MNAEQVSQYLPVLKQAVAVNTLLILYFILPNFTSFFLATLLLLALFAPTLLQRVTCCEERCGWSFNSIFAEYLALSGVRKAMVVVGLGVTAQLTYLLPTWFILVVAGEVLAFWEILVALGVVELAAGAINSTDTALTKFLNLIPKYED